MNGRVAPGSAYVYSYGLQRCLGYRRGGSDDAGDEKSRFCRLDMKHYRRHIQIMILALLLMGGLPAVSTAAPDADHPYDGVYSGGFTYPRGNCGGTSVELTIRDSQIEGTFSQWGGDTQFKAPVTEGRFSGKSFSMSSDCLPLVNPWHKILCHLPVRPQHVGAVQKNPAAPPTLCQTQIQYWISQVFFCQIHGNFFSSTSRNPISSNRKLLDFFRLVHSPAQNPQRKADSIWEKFPISAKKIQDKLIR